MYKRRGRHPKNLASKQTHLSEPSDTEKEDRSPGKALNPDSVDLEDMIAAEVNQKETTQADGKNDAGTQS